MRYIITLTAIIGTLIVGVPSASAVDRCVIAPVGTQQRNTCRPVTGLSQWDSIRLHALRYGTHARNASR